MTLQEAFMHEDYVDYALAVFGVKMENRMVRRYAWRLQIEQYRANIGGVK